MEQASAMHNGLVVLSVLLDETSNDNILLSTIMKNLNQVTQAGSKAAASV